MEVTKTKKKANSQRKSTSLESDIPDAPSLDEFLPTIPAASSSILSALENDGECTGISNATQSKRETEMQIEESQRDSFAEPGVFSGVKVCDGADNEPENVDAVMPVISSLHSEQGGLTNAADNQIVDDSVKQSPLNNLNLVEETNVEEATQIQEELIQSEKNLCDPESSAEANADVESNFDISDDTRKSLSTEMCSVLPTGDEVSVAPNEHEVIASTVLSVTECVAVSNVPEDALPAVSTSFDLITSLQLQPCLSFSDQTRDVIPLTRTQLANFYYNPLISQQEASTLGFVQQESTFDSQSELYVLLCEYLRACRNFSFLKKELQQYLVDNKRFEQALWTRIDASRTLSGKCSDQWSVSKVITFQSMHFDSAALNHLKTSMESSCELLNDRFSLKYNLYKQARFKIENFFYVMCQQHPQFGDLPQNAPVVSVQNTDDSGTVLFTSLNILLSFLRQPSLDPLFINDLKEWTENLISSLLRVASFHAHEFLFQHCIRLPPGSLNFVSPFIQVVVPESSDRPFDNNSVHLFLYFVSLLCSPVVAREVFLRPFNPSSSPGNTDPISWALVDNNGDLESISEDSWHSFTEDDLIMALEQLPFQEIFKLILRIRDFSSAGLTILPQLYSEHEFLRLLAFARCLVSTLCSGAKLYNEIRFIRFTRRLSRLIRHTVSYVSDFGQLLFDYFKDSPLLSQLKCNFDAFFLFVVGEICDNCSEPWTTISELPYNNLSTMAMERIILHALGHNSLLGNTNQHNSFLALFSGAQWKLMLVSQLMVVCSDGERIYFLTLFMNLACASESHSIIAMATNLVFQASFICEETRDLLPKNGRSLLRTICETHPHVVSHLLRILDEIHFDNDDLMASTAAPLFSDLPISRWSAKIEDIAVVFRWLSKCPLTDWRNQLARLILTKFQYGYLPEQGLALTGSRDSVDYNRLYSLCWSIVIRLYLDQPIVDDDLAVHGLSEEAASGNPLAAYLRLMLSDLTRRPTRFIEKGLNLLISVAKADHFEATVKVLDRIIRLFLSTDCALLAKHQRFQDLLAEFNQSSQSYSKKAIDLMYGYTPSEKLTSLTGLMIYQIGLSDDSEAEEFLQFWADAVMHRQQWWQNKWSLHLIDTLAKVSLPRSCLFEKFISILDKKYEDCCASLSNRSLLTSVSSWLSSTPHAHSFMEGTAPLPQFVFFAYMNLLMETLHEDRLGIWSELVSRLRSEPNVRVALKKVADDLNLSAKTPSVEQLVIYRWAIQAQSTPRDHPLSILFWQQFFSRFLFRLQEDISSGSVGLIFFESYSNTSWQKQLKRSLNANSKELFDELRNDETMDRESAKYHLLISRAKLFEAFSLWIDEPRLHEGSLYLPALPAQYDSAKLLQIFNGSKDIWLDLVDMEALNGEISAAAEKWKKDTHHFDQIQRRSLSPNPERSATEKIVTRLQQMTDIRPPPPVRTRQMPFPRIADEVLFGDSASMIAEMQPSILQIQQFARDHTELFREMRSLTGGYIESVPSQYRNVHRDKIEHIQCSSRVNFFHQCKGPAVVNYQIEEVEEDSTASAQIASYKERLKSLQLASTEPIQPGVLSSIAAIDYAISRMKEVSTSLPRNTSTFDNFSENACAFFYHIIESWNDDCSACIVVRQFLSTQLEILGQEFIENKPRECVKVLGCIRNHAQHAQILSSFFNPFASIRNSSDVFLQAYEEAVNYSRGLTDPTNGALRSLPITLFSKFSINSWLSLSNPNTSDCHRLSEAIANALFFCGKEPKDEQLILCEIHRRHLMALLAYKFPLCYSDVLQLLLNGSSRSELSPSVWTDLLAFFGCSDDRPYAARIQNVNSTGLMLPFTQALETVDLLTNFFMKQRLEKTPDGSENSQFGLYPRWKCYLVPLSSFFRYLLERVIFSESELGDKIDSVLERTWVMTNGLVSPWTQPIISNDVYSPWLSADAGSASLMLDVFIDVILILWKKYGRDDRPDSLVTHRTAFHYCWHYYATCLAQPTTPGHVLITWHSHLIRLPWNRFLPDFAAFSLFLEVIDRNLREPTKFIYQITMVFSWNLIFTAYQVESHLRHLLPTVSSLTAWLFVKLSLDQGLSVKEKEQILKVASTINSKFWSFVPAADFARLAQYISDAAPRLQTHQLVDLLQSSKFGLLSLYYSMCHVTDGSSTEATDNPDYLERLSAQMLNYAQLCVRLLARYSHELPADIEVAVFSERVRLLVGEVLNNPSHVLVNQDSDANIGRKLIVTEVASLLDQSNPDASACQQAIVNGLSKCKYDYQPELISASCQLQNTSGAIFLLEGLLENYINDRPHSENSWENVARLLTLTTERITVYASKAEKSDCPLVLYGLFIKQLNQGSDQQRACVEQVLQWVVLIKPCTNAEWKFLLILVAFLQVLPFAAKESCFLARLDLALNALLSLAEDRNSYGVFGAIGLGRRSPYTIRFRLACRLVAALLASHGFGREKNRTTAANCLEAVKNHRDYKPVFESQLNLSHIVNEVKCQADPLHLLRYFCEALFWEYLPVRIALNPY